MNPYELLKPAAIASPALAPARAKRIYAAAEFGRLEGGWSPTSSSADAEIVTSLRVMRNRSRQLVRDNEYAKNGLRQVVQNVIGGGIGMQPTVKNLRGKLIDNLNDQIRECWHDWWKRPDQVHTAGLMSGPDIERYMMSNVVESGEAFVRLVRRPFGSSKIPLALEVIEADRVMDQWTQAIAPNGAVIRMGIEMDSWHRPTGYWCWPVHPGDWQFSTFEPSSFIRIPAGDMIHAYVIDRWPQSRGVPWFHAAMRRLNHMGGYEEAEIVRARMSAAVMGFITSPDIPQPDDIENGQRLDDMEPGQIRHLNPGETFAGFNPSTPNATFESFMRLMIRGVASAVGMSYETLARDYTNTNYSSARASQLEDRDNWKVIQGWYINAARRRIYEEFLDAAVISGALSIDDFYTNMQKYVKAHFVPRGWSWIDPQKEVTAYIKAVRANMMTLSDVIAQTNNGRDAEEVFKERRRELDIMAEEKLVSDSDPAQVNMTGIAQPNTAPEEEEDRPAEPGEDASQSDDAGDSEANQTEEAAPAAADKEPPAKASSGSKPAKKAA